MFATVFLRKQLGLVAGTTREDIISCFFLYIYIVFPVVTLDISHPFQVKA